MLQHPQNDLPKYSISVGIAFSENGYSDELFRQADQALYHTKENGRCGYTFYQS
ncbi:MAG: diguanylate cyclase [Kineothrix sp.]|nr:diguanylate cyclase [Kineothrix sp.]